MQHDMIEFGLQPNQNMKKSYVYLYFLIQNRNQITFINQRD